MAGKGMFLPAKISEKLQADSVKSTVVSLSALPGKGASSPSCPEHAQAVLLGLVPIRKCPASMTSW